MNGLAPAAPRMRIIAPAAVTCKSIPVAEMPRRLYSQMGSCVCTHVLSNWRKPVLFSQCPPDTGISGTRNPVIFVFMTDNFLPQNYQLQQTTNMTWII